MFSLQETSEQILQGVYDSLQCSRAMAQLLMTVPPRTPSGTPTSTPPLNSVSFDASRALSGSQGSGTSGAGLDGVDGGVADAHHAPRDHITALRRPVTPDMRLSSVAGMATAKQLLTEAVVLPIRYRHLFTGMYSHIPCRGVLILSNIKLSNAVRRSPEAVAQRAVVRTSGHREDQACPSLGGRGQRRAVRHQPRGPPV